MTAPAIHPDAQLAHLMADYYADPLGFVMDCFPWGKPGTVLEHESGPDTWQREALIQIGKLVKAHGFDGVNAVEPIRFTRASGHGIGKSTIIAWIALWICSTRPYSQGTVTANTYTQLETKTWASIVKWAKLCATRDWWVIGAGGLYHREARESWFLNCQTCSEENSEAFAGQHAKNSTSYYLVDESSAVPEATWEVIEGGLTDGEPMVFAFGNPTRNTGRFYEINFGRLRHRWHHGAIDSRTSRFANKDLIDQWIQDYGIESDFCRVRILGLPPQQSESQLISRTLVEGAAGRSVMVLRDEPLIAGVDVPDGGSAWFIVRFRRGHDGNAAPPIRIPGSKCDRPLMISILANVLQQGVELRDGLGWMKVSAVFVDSAFGSPIVERLHSLGYDQVHEVNFGGKSPDVHMANMRAYMWCSMRDWLEKGSLDKADQKIAVDLTSPGWHYNKSNAIVLESKEEMARDGRPSPDDGDALALTFAQRVAPIEPARRDGYGSEYHARLGPNAWMA